MDDRIDNEAFFASQHAHAAVASIPERAFYAGRARPPPEPTMATRAAATPLRFALVVFLVGWAGILFQRNFLQQVVFGAPVFEEFAKLGPALILVALLRVRTLWIRLPLAWASGIAFGFMEHYTSYPGEDMISWVGRVAFHGASPGLSMLVFSAVEDLPDVRARWASTIPSTLFHWANNFLSIVLGIAAAVLGSLGDPIGLLVSMTLTSGIIVLTVVGILWRRAFVERVRRILAVATPRFMAAGR